MDDEAEKNGKEREGGGGDKGEAVVLSGKIDQMTDDGAKGHDTQSNEHIESGVKLGEVFFGKHAQGQGGRAGEPSPR